MLSRFRTALRPARTFTTSARALDAHAPKPPALYGPGAKEGTIPTDEDQATGLERFELIGKAKGIDVFDMSPLNVDRMGTMKDPILVPSLHSTRIVGSTGFPVDSNDTIWLTLDIRKNNGIGRCPESGVVYKLDYQGPPLDEAHH